MKRSGILRYGLPIMGLLIVCSGMQAKEISLEAGCARIDITPPVGTWLSGYGARNRPSDGLCDPLYAKALVLDDGQTKVAIVCTDLLWVPLELTNAVRARIKERTGIVEDNVLICATHTHFGPKVDRPTKNWPDAADSKIDTEYVDQLQSKLVTVVVRGNEKLIPAKLGAAHTVAEELLYNRRTRKPDGTVEMTFRLPASSEELTFGPVDANVAILKVENGEGQTAATLINFACHPVSGAKEKETFYSISADYPGYAAEVVEQVEGGLCMFALGTAGNMNPVRLNRTDPRRKIGRALGAATVRRLQFAPTSGDVRLSAVRKSIDLPLKQTQDVEGEEDGKKAAATLQTEVQAMRLGDVYILGLPGEILVEIGLTIKRGAEIDNLFIISLANDGCGYVCHRAAYKEGGYEPERATNLAEGAGELIQEHALELLEELKNAM